MVEVSVGLLSPNVNRITSSEVFPDKLKLMGALIRPPWLEKTTSL